jgi:UDP-N-acetylmuramate dehydrogenase
VDFDFPKVDKLEFENKVKNFSKIRKESQPQGKSLGCIFKNPPNISAGKLIESVGLKGYKIGGAEVSNVHGNFIINAKNATASDVVKLINEIKIQVKNKTGISLSEEIEYVGKFTK